jgi:DNA-binding response OmpR family regulator
MPGNAQQTILVIDNDRSSRQLLRLHLGNAGYRTLEAEDGVAGGRMLVEHSPDLVLLETDLPYLSGLDLIATLAIDHSAPAMPVIFIAGNEGERLRAQQLGDACLMRPFFADELLRTVGRLLDWSGAPGASA